jgi:hypothetical protein
MHAEMLQSGAFIDDFFEQIEVHETFRAAHPVRYITKGATEVAGVGWFDDERCELFDFH